jgi:valyl-tRNA synthetase
LGWPKQKAGDYYDRFYPSSVLVTGYDILFFWVARMAMLGLELTGSVPFHTVYLHGLVRDGEGQKMSKTKGNVIDPLQAVEQYGSDALRHGLLSSLSAQGHDVPMSNDTLEASRNFITKLWNIGKFINHKLTTAGHGSTEFVDIGDFKKVREFPLAEQNILFSCNHVIKQATTNIEDYKFAEAIDGIQSFIWNDFASWYLEMSKTRSGQNSVAVSQSNAVLATVWSMCLRALHPVVPFITESLWQSLHHIVAKEYVGNVNACKSIMVSNWPTDSVCGHSDYAEVAEQIRVTDNIFKDIVVAIRNVRAEYKAEASRKIPACIQLKVATNSTADMMLLLLLQQETAALALLAGLNPKDVYTIVVDDRENVWENRRWATSDCAHVVVRDNVHVFVPLSGMVDAAQEIARLDKAAKQLQREIDGLRSRVNNSTFLQKASPAVVQEAQRTLQEKLDKLDTIQNGIRNYSKP